MNKHKSEDYKISAVKYYLDYCNNILDYKNYRVKN